jgi:hypothetical protein
MKQYEQLYQTALQYPGENIGAPADEVIELIERCRLLSAAVSDMEAALRTCQNASTGVMNQYRGKFEWHAT